MVRGLGVYAPMALLPDVIIEKLREKYDPDIYRTSIMIMKLVGGGVINSRFWIDTSPDLSAPRSSAMVDVLADELTEGEQAVIDTVLKIGAVSAMKKI